MWIFPHNNLFPNLEYCTTLYDNNESKTVHKNNSIGLDINILNLKWIY